ncbi:MAG: fibronectin type III domain-containing protein, partial [Candidatus Woesearchaeota archaeon]
LPADSTVHTIKATYAGYYEAEETFMITSSQPVVDVPLNLHIAEAICKPDNWLPISGINYEFVPGEPEVTLSWNSPCPETLGYQVTRIDPSGEETSYIFSSDTTSFWDTGLDWGLLYSYVVTVIYESGARIYTSEGFQIDLQIGDEICANYEVGETFCEAPEVSEEYSGLIPGSSTTPSSSSSPSTSEDPIYSCGPDNRYTQIDTCEEGFCASDRTGGTTCLNDDVCKTGGRPFGLYYDRQMCYYGDESISLDSIAAPSQFCYYDYNTQKDTPTTIVDSCGSCTNIKSCFDYLSADACSFNSCLTTNCSWVPAAATFSESPLVDYSGIFRALSLNSNDAEAVFPETGAGYCVQLDYNKDDKCNQCDSKNGEVFENYLCTPDVCTNLGRCFSNPLGYPGRTTEPLLSFCATCGDHPTEYSTCYTYTTKLECIGNSSISATNGVISFSEDNCNWGRCYWDGSSCLKDGDYNEEGDCDETDSRCKQDNTAPMTTIINGPVPQISLNSPKINFEGDDSLHPFPNQQNDLFQFGYCLLPADSPESCSSFKTLDYSRRTGKETIVLDVLKEVTEYLDGVIYKIFYYSEDEYSNRESAKSSMIYIDNVVPDFEINETILINQDRVKLKAWLDNPSELMSCNFTLSRPNADVYLQSYEKGNAEVKFIEFTEIQNIVNAELNVTCVDLSGNTNSKSKRYTFDLEENIDIVYPLLNSYVAETSISFEVKTTVDAKCFLVRNNEQSAEFSWTNPESRKEHKTERQLEFTQREYFEELKVVCQPFAELEPFEEYFHFTIDLTAPLTQIILTEGAREYRPI